MSHWLNWKKTTVMVSALALASGAAMADTIKYLHMDINTFQVSAEPSAGGTGGATFGTNFTGVLNLGVTADTVMAVDINGDTTTSGFTGDIVGLNGQLSLTNGQVTGGSVSVTAIDNSNGGTDTYSYNVVNDSGSVTMPADPTVFAQQGYSLTGATNNGMFTADDFGGTDVSFWRALQPLPGSFLQFHYRPNATGMDNQADMELYVIGNKTSGGPTVPLPMSALGGAVGIGMVNLYQWRRRRHMRQMI